MIFFRPFLLLVAILFFQTQWVFAEDKVVSAAPAVVSTASAFGSSPIRVVQWPQAGSVQAEYISILKSASLVVRFDRTIVRAAISNPAICDITNIGARDILIYAKEAGIVNLFVWDEEENIATYSVESSLDLVKLRRILNEVDADSKIRVVPFNKSLAVYGTAETSVKLKQIGEAAKAFDPNVLNFVKLRESKQVLLEVRFAEINRKANKDFQFDLNIVSGYHFFKFDTGQTGATSTSDGTYTAKSVDYNVLHRAESSVSNILYGFTSNGLLFKPYLQWLEQKNILKIIARPNLVAKDGEEAKFLVGGEFPVPTSSSNGTSIEYKEFGTQIKFIPEILDSDVIRLKVDSEISELDFSSTVTSGGTTVPIITKRTHNTVTEMKDNETFVIGGIITQKINKINRRVPLLGDLPLFNPLFRADDFSRTDVELIIVITPHVIKPVELEEKKALYNAQDVKEAVKVFSPVYSDPQGDSIQRMVVGNENRDANFGKPKKESVEVFVDEISQALEEGKQRRMQTAMADRYSGPGSANFTTANKPKPVKATPTPRLSMPKPTFVPTPTPRPTATPTPKPVATPTPRPVVLPTPVPTPTPDTDSYNESPFYKTSETPSRSYSTESSGNRGNFSGGSLKQS